MDFRGYLAELNVVISSAGRRPRIPGAVLCMGDSLTAASYPRVLSKLLGVPTINRGVGGQTSREILARYQPDGAAVVFWMGNNNYYEPDQVLRDVAAAVKRAVDAGQDYRVVGLVNGDFPDRRRGGEGYAQILACNAELRRLYASRFVDMRAALWRAAETGEADVIPRALRVDDIHLNRTGYVAAAKAIAATF